MSDGARNWSSYTHEIMTMVGLQEAWESGVVGDDWDQRVFGKVKAWEEEQWRAGMQSKSKLRVYRRVKTELKREDYLQSSKIEGRRQMTQLRGGTNSLRVETGIWEGKQLEDRKCRQCGDGVEDEEHVLLHCNLYDDLRREMMEDRRMHAHVYNGWWNDDNSMEWMVEYMLAGGKWEERGGCNVSRDKDEASMEYMKKVMSRRKRC